MSTRRFLRRALATLMDRFHPCEGEAARKAARAYWIALTLLAITNVVIFTALMGGLGADEEARLLRDRVVEHRADAHRVAGLLRLMANEPNGRFVERDRARARGALERMREGHATLAARPETREIFAGDGMNLSAATGAFFADATRAIETGEKNASERLRAALSGPFMEALGALIERREEMARDAAMRTTALHWFLLFATLLLVAGEAIGIFRPLVRDLDRIERRLRLKQDELHRQSHQDQLTGLPNRRHLRDHVNGLADSPNRCCVVAMDLDNFKAVNDTYGHAAGDRVLLVVADALRDCIRDADQAFRIGGDEFVIILAEERAGTDWSRGMELATERMAAHVRSSLAGFAQARGVSASFGYREMHADDSFDTVLADADAALYHAKTSGKDQVVRHSPLLASEQTRRLATEGLIRDALARDAFEPFFQPQVDIETGRANGLEVLARLRAVDGSVKEPDAFLEFATETGLICAIGERVIDKALLAARRWPQQRLSINLCAAQLHDPDVVDFLCRSTRAAGRAFAEVELEVPEGALHGDDAALATIRDLQARGFRLSVGDFGRGVVSLVAMTEAGIDRLKVDRTVLLGEGDAPGGRDAERDRILGLIRAMADTFELETIVEGVETQAQIGRVQAAGYAHAQGFAFARPMDEARTARWLRGATAPSIAPSLDDLSLPESADLARAE